MPNFNIKPTIEDICSCNCCDSRTYESKSLHYGKVVPIIYDVKIGNMTNHMCPECLRAFIEAANTELAKENT